MKKILLSLSLCGLSAVAQETQQTFVYQAQTNISYTFPPVTWSNANAQVIARQLASLTNSQGEYVVPQGFLETRSSAIHINVHVSNNELLYIKAQVEP